MTAGTNVPSGLADSEASRQQPAGAAGPASGRAARNVVALVASELLGKGATLAFTVVVARQLGATAFGSFSYALAFGVLLSTLITWGFDAEVLRRGSQDPQDLDAALSQALALRSMHAVVIGLLGGAAGVLTRPDAASAQVLLLVLAATVLDSYGDAGRAAATARERPGPAGFVLVGQRVAACVLAVAVLRLGGGIVAVSVAYMASSALGLVLLAVLLRRLAIRPRRSALSATALRSSWRDALLLGLETVLGMALFRLDMLMVGMIAGNDEVAVYAVGYRLMESVLFVTWAVSRSLFPALVRAGTGWARLRVGENALAVAAVVLVPYGVVMLLDGGQVLRLLFGAEYVNASVVALRWLAFAPVAFALSYFCGYLLFVQGRTAAMMLSTAAAVGVNIALNAAVIPSFGARGAAFATTASYGVQGLLRVVLVARSGGWFRLDRSLALCSLAAIPLAAVLVVTSSAPVVPAVALGGVVYLVVYLALARWRDPAQIAVLRSLVPRTRN